MAPNIKRVDVVKVERKWSRAVSRHPFALVENGNISQARFDSEESARLATRDGEARVLRAPVKRV